MANDLEAVARWHDGLAVKSRKRFMQFGEVEIIDLDSGVDAVAFHTEAAAAIRAAMGEIERLNALLEVLQSIKWVSADRDNMEFSARVTYVQMDALRALTAQVQS